MAKKDKNVESDALLVGIDLGTSRSVIVANNGKRFLCPSVAGWPKDMVAVKLFGKSVLMGEEALQHRDSLNLCFPLSEGIIDEAEPRAIEASEALLEHLISEVADDKNYKYIYGIIGVPSKISEHSQAVLSNIAGDFMDSARVVSEPFAVAYNEDKLSRAIIVDIGAGTVDICGTKGTIPGEDDQATLTKGGDHVDHLLLGALNEKYPNIDLNIFITKKIKEEFGFVGKPPGKAVWEFRSGGLSVNHSVSEEIEQSCRSILPDIVEAVKHVAATFDPEFQAEALMNVVLSGGMSQVANVEKEIEKKLIAEVGDAKVTIASDPVYAGAQGSLKLLMDIPSKFYPKLDSVAL